MFVPGIETYIRGEIAKGRPIKFEDLMAHMKVDHTPVEDVGRIAQEAGVKTLVLSLGAQAVYEAERQLTHATEPPAWQATTPEMDCIQSLADTPPMPR